MSSVLQRTNLRCTMPDLGHRDEDSRSENYQDIPGRNINPAKLTALLKSSFGIGSYEIYMMHNTYSVKAPRQLSMHEISRCR